jgi:hypothetical protein
MTCTDIGIWGQAVMLGALFLLMFVCACACFYKALKD